MFTVYEGRIDQAHYEALCETLYGTDRSFTAVKFDGQQSWYDGSEQVSNEHVVIAKVKDFQGTIYSVLRKYGFEIRGEALN